MRAAVHVCVVIVGFRNVDDVSTCLDALGTSTYSDFEVVICENGGASAALSLKQEVPVRLQGGQGVQVIDAGDNLGYAGGINRAMRASADADAWWILNPDACAAPGAMAAMVDRLSRGDVEAVGGPIVTPAGLLQSLGGHWRPWLARAVSIGNGASLHRAVDPQTIERRQNYLNGASMMVSRMFVQCAGPMREDYFLYCEETEWCLRALRQGLRLGFAPDGVVTHVGGSTTGAGGQMRLRKKLPIYLNARNSILLTRDMYPARLPIAMPAFALQQTIRFGARGAWRQVGYALAGVVAGLRGLRGAPPWAL